MNRFAKFMRDYSLARFLIPLGVVLIAFGAVMFGIIAKQIGYKKVDSTISRIELYEEEHTEDDTHYDTTYTTYVKYTVDGKEYEAELGQYAGVKVGDKKTIIYNPKNPTEISEKVNIIVPIAIIAAGAVSLIGAIISIMRTRKKNKALRKQEEEWTYGR